MKKVAIIGTAGVPARYGGFETLAHQLVLNLNKKFKLSVYCSTHLYAKSERKKTWNGARLFHIPFNANGAQSIIYDIISILHALFYADTLLVLGVSGGIIIPFVKAFTSKKIIVNIDGLEWRRAKWNPAIQKFLKFSEYLAVKFSDADITDNFAIKEYTAKHYKTLSYLVEYGGDHAKPVKLRKKDYQTYPFLKSPYAFKVCRIEPENNVHVILGAFKRMPKKNLVVVGNWQSSEYGKNLIKEYEKVSNVHLLNPIYEQTELDKLRSNCYLYMHGHSAGGTNPSLVEAMYLGLPIVSFDVSYNRHTTKNLAVYFKNENDLVEAIQKMDIKQLHNLKDRMKAVANANYTWKIIAQKYEHLIMGFDFEYAKKPLLPKFSNINSKYLAQEGIAHLKHTQFFYENR